MDFLATFGCDTHFKSELCQNHYRPGQLTYLLTYKIFSIKHSFH